jgi:hypothetical protein
MTQVAGDGSTKRGTAHSAAARPQRLPGRKYEAELLRLQSELVKLQEWVRA